MSAAPHVYIYRDPRDSQPLYVGHSITRRRARKHWLLGDRHDNPDLRAVFTELSAAKLEPIIERQYFADVGGALQREVELIAKWGRRHLGTGSLCNRSPGGEGAGSEAVLRFLEANPDHARLASERGREIMLKLNSDPEFTKGNRERLVVTREALRKKMADPEFAEAKAERTRRGRLKRLATDQEFATAHAERARQTLLKRHAMPLPPEFITAQAERTRKHWADPEYRTKMLAARAAAAARKRAEKSMEGDE